MKFIPQYPRRDLCERLKKIGFPCSEKTLWINPDDTAEIKLRAYGIQKEADKARIVFPCPNASEILEHLPEIMGYHLIIRREEDFSYACGYDQHFGGKPLKYYADMPLEDALAELLLWAYREDYFDFS